MSRSGSRWPKRRPQWLDAVDIVVYDGVDEMDALGPLEVLRSAAAARADPTVQLVTRQAQAVVLGAWGLRFLADAIYAPGACATATRRKPFLFGDVPLRWNIGKTRRVPAPMAALLSHRRLRRRIEPYVDGELAPAERLGVRRHLDCCWGCSDAADVVRLIKRSLGHLAERRPPALAAVRLQGWARSVPDRLR